jgi:hypothetical protein
VTRFLFAVEVDVERVGGKWVARAELAERLRLGLVNGEPDSLRNGTTYEVVAWDVTLIEGWQREPMDLSVEQLEALRADWVVRHAALSTYYGMVRDNIATMTLPQLRASKELRLDAMLAHIEGLVERVVRARPSGTGPFDPEVQALEFGPAGDGDEP